MRSSTPTLHCDGTGDDDCGRWDVDWYEATASTVSGVRITRTTRSPGWLSTDDSDYCPERTPRESA